MSVLDNALQALFSGQVKIEKVWENADTSSAFPEQEIAIDFSDADGAIVYSRYAADYLVGLTKIIFRTAEINRSVFMDLSIRTNMYRSCDVRSNRIEFGKGQFISTYGEITDNDNYIIPTEIYRFKILPVIQSISGGGSQTD